MSGDVYPNVGKVVVYWRTVRLELTQEQFVKSILDTSIQLDYPGGPFGKLGRVDPSEFTVEELQEWEEGLSDIECWALVIRDIATAFGIPTRKILSTPPGGVGKNIAYFRQTLLKIPQEELAERIRVTPAEMKDIEEGRTPLERVGRIFSAMAKLCEEPIFNFWRPGHHIQRKTLEQLAEARNQEQQKREQMEINRQKEEERTRLMREEQLKRLEARKKALEERNKKA